MELKKIHDFIESQKEQGYSWNQIINNFNKQFNKQWKKRNLQQKYHLYKNGYGGANVEMPDYITQKEIELEIKKKELQKYKAQVNSLLNVEAKKNTLLEVFKETYLKPFNYKMKEVHWDKKPAAKTMIVLISDLHFQDESDIDWVERIFGIVYNKWHDALINYYDDFVLAFLGDDIEGAYAHINQIGNMSGVNQIRMLQEIYSQNINKIFHSSKNWTTKPRMNVVFVDKSNHSQIRNFNSARSQFQQEDLLLLVGDHLKRNLDPKISVFTGDEVGVVHTRWATFLHGHQSFAKERKSLESYLGYEHDIIMGHYHHAKMTDNNRTTLYVAPSCKRAPKDYEKDGGYFHKPAIMTIIKEDDGCRMTRTVQTEEIVERKGRS